MFCARMTLERGASKKPNKLTLDVERAWIEIPPSTMTWDDRYIDEIGEKNRQAKMLHSPCIAVPSTYAIIRLKSWETVAICGLNV